LQTLSFRDDLILDGELIVYDPEEKRDMWELAMNRFQLKQEQKIKLAAEKLPCTYIVFDVLYCNRSLLNMELMDRKKILNEVVENGPFLQKISYLEAEGVSFFEQIEQLRLEGICAKLKKSKYIPSKRVDFWRKIVRYEYFDNILITGFRKKDFGLLCSFVSEQGLKPAGVIEFAPPQLRKDFFRKVSLLEDRQDQLNIYLKQGIPAKVKTRGLTKKGYLRTPVLVELL
jgi:DNA ligase 1